MATSVLPGCSGVPFPALLSGAKSARNFTAKKWRWEVFQRIADLTDAFRAAGRQAYSLVPCLTWLSRCPKLKELEFDGNWIEDQAAEARRWIEEERTDDPFGHVGGPVQAAEYETRVLERLGLGVPETSIEVTGDPEALIQELEATGSLVSEHLAEDDQAPATVAWAAGGIVRLAGVYGATPIFRRRCARRITFRGKMLLGASQMRLLRRVGTSTCGHLRTHPLQVWGICC
jgi:hypothetical protein